MSAGISLSAQSWFLAVANRADREGMRYAREEMKFLLRDRKAHWVVYAALEGAAKYMGYKMGLNHSRLPKSLIRRIVSDGV